MSFSHLNLRRLLAIGCLSLVAGCGPREEIARYTVPKPELIDPTQVSAPAEAKSQQTLGAIVLTDDAGWFFKLTGDPKLVEPKRGDFEAFVKAVRFSTGPQPQPSWDLPAGWKEQPASQFRFATLIVPTESEPLALAVSMLPLGEDFSPEEYVLKNVNRWRGQVGLDEIDQAELAKTTETFKIGDFDGTLVSLVGESAGGGMGGGSLPPFAAGGAPLPGSSPTAPVRKAPEGSSLKFDAPEGWTAGQTTQFRRATFNVQDGAKEVEITVIPLGLGSGSLLQNVNRWREEQLQMPPITEADLAKSVKKIETLGVSGDYVELHGKIDGQPGTILGVAAEARGQVWFIKLMGDSDLAQREKPRFESFVKSLKLK